MCKCIKENNNFRIAFQRQFIDKLTKNAYIKGPTKRQCTTIKQTLITNYYHIDENYNSVPWPEIEVETWIPKKEIKKKQDNSFLSLPIAPINFTKKLHQTAIYKNRRKYKDQGIKTQGSSSEKKNIKCHDKEHENAFKDNLTEPNEYSKGYQIYRKIHIPDLLNRFKEWAQLSWSKPCNGCFYKVSWPR